jgi:hypothetical protein
MKHILRVRGITNGPSGMANFTASISRLEYDIVEIYILNVSLFVRHYNP